MALPSLENDEHASSFLTHCCTIKNGVMRPKVPEDKISDIEWHAIRYLCEEWDFAYIGDPKPHADVKTDGTTVSISELILPISTIKEQ